MKYTQAQLDKWREIYIGLCGDKQTSYTRLSLSSPHTGRTFNFVKPKDVYIDDKPQKKARYK